MPAEQTAAELTTRDVLLQVDRRLTLIEGDLRSLDEKLDDKIDGLRSEFSTRLSDEIGGLRHEMSTHFKWTIGTLVTLAGLIAVAFKL